MSNQPELALEDNLQWIDSLLNNPKQANRQNVQEVMDRAAPLTQEDLDFLENPSEEISYGG